MDDLHTSVKHPDNVFALQEEVPPPDYYEKQGLMLQKHFDSQIPDGHLLTAQCDNPNGNLLPVHNNEKRRCTFVDFLHYRKLSILYGFCLAMIISVIGISIFLVVTHHSLLTRYQNPDLAPRDGNSQHGFHSVIGTYSPSNPAKIKRENPTTATEQEPFESHIEQLDQIIEVVGSQFDQIVENIPQKDWPKLEEYLVAARDVLKLFIRDNFFSEGWSFTEENVTEVAKKLESRLRQSIDLPPLLKMARRELPKQKAESAISRKSFSKVSEALPPAFDESCKLAKHSRFPVDSDLLRSIGFQIGVYPQREQELLVTTASQTVVNLLNSRQTRFCSTDDLEHFASKVASKIRESITRKRCRNEPKDSAKMELAIFRLRVTAVMFHHYYQMETLQSYTKVFVDAFPVLTQQHPAPEVADCLLQGILELVKLSQVTTFRQYQKSLDDMFSSLAFATKWPKEESTHVFSQPALVLSTFFSSSESERVQRVEDLAREQLQQRGRTGFETTQELSGWVEYSSRVLDDLERYFTQFFHSVNEIQKEHSIHSEKSDAAKVVNLRKRQDQTDQTDEADETDEGDETDQTAQTDERIQTIQTPPTDQTDKTDQADQTDQTGQTVAPEAPPEAPPEAHINGILVDGIDTPTASLRKPKVWWSTTGIIIMALVLSLVIFVIFWVYIMKCCFRPSEIRKTAGAQEYRVCRNCSRPCNYSSRTCSGCKQPTTKPKFSDNWVWRWGKSQGTSLPVTEKTRNKPYRPRTEEPIICLDGACDEMSRGNELKVAKRPNATYYLATLRLPKATFHTVRKYSGIGPDVDGIAEEMAATEKHIKWGSTV
ncbi:hypothetical protein GLAREA_12292 [Glarea lozoyensis ATCC 20868]|uniref:Uncharacterized protein n=1 Tax=Glarea lozoyensis (strain ATCC 20868 / MF5171) TaxID=1116229 RepID=S3DHM2_GLAL2|nr:uncharacterized protein GLAREA_12292 [Glarea lozoyensis ATCC 20868]EPE31536.1 hypothetical protein GLAREA_12292 [Glarea lozoyensis ATCC 20868]